MPGDLRIRYCSRIPADSWAETPCNRVGKSTRGRPRTPGKQRWAHTAKAGTGSGGQPARGSRLEGTRITSSFAGQHATSRKYLHKVTRQTKENKEESKQNTSYGKDPVLRMGWHLTNGFPVKRGRQLQIGLWFTTSHRAPTPQVPGQGFLHFWLLHASF